MGTPVKMKTRLRMLALSWVEPFLFLIELSAAPPLGLSPGHALVPNNAKNRRLVIVE